MNLGSPDVKKIPIQNIDVIVEYQRKQICQEHVGKLKESMKDCAQLAPIIVTQNENGKYLLIDGHHRLEALKQMGQPNVLASIFHLDEKTRAEVLLYGTIQKTLTKEDKSLFAYRLVEIFGMNQKKAAKFLGVAEAHISSWIKVYKNSSLKEPVEAKKIPMETAVELASVEFTQEDLKLIIDWCSKKKNGKFATRELIRQIKNKDILERVKLHPTTVDVNAMEIMIKNPCKELLPKIFDWYVLHGKSELPSLEERMKKLCGGILFEECFPQEVPVELPQEHKKLAYDTLKSIYQTLENDDKSENTNINFLNGTIKIVITEVGRELQEKIVDIIKKDRTDSMDRHEMLSTVKIN